MTASSAYPATDLRAPHPDDVEGFAELHAHVWRTAYRGLMDDPAVDDLTAERFRPMWYSVCRAYAEDRVPEDGRGITVALVDGAPAGFLMHGPARDAEPPAPHQLWALNVAPEHWGAGLAQRLLDECFVDGPAYLWVARGNDRAIRFYERNGFALDGATEPGPDGLAELRMVRPA